MITETLIIEIAKFLTIYLSTYITILTTSTLYFNTLTLLSNKLRVKRLSKTGYIINNQIQTPPHIDKLEVRNEIYNIIMPYIEKLKDYTKEDNLQALYRNIKNVTLKKQSPITPSFYSGLYNSQQNKITYLNKTALGHEILHMASAYYDKETNISYVGFKQSKDKVYIGQGLNEGYTELLNARIYNNNKISAYYKEAKIAKLLEFFFDDPKEMEAFYFNHNLPGLIHHLEQYTSRENIVKILLDIDQINSYSHSIYSAIPTIKSIKTQISLYNIFEKTCPNKQKVEQFKNIVCEDKMAAIILNGKKAALKRKNIFQKPQPTPAYTM